MIMIMIGAGTRMPETIKLINNKYNNDDDVKNRNDNNSNNNQ